MDWTRDGRDWPNRAQSRFVDSRPHRWHVQVAGTGPALLLLHGTGAATHSWRDLLPILARHHMVIAPDLPGHGFTRLGTRRRSSLPSMAEDLWHLCDALGLAPRAAIGHSAGCAIALEMAQSRPGIGHVIGLNAALGSFDGPAAFLFPTMARMLAATPFVPVALAGVISATGGVSRLLEATGSRLDARGVALYRRLVAQPSHVEGAIEMMAQWSTRNLCARLPQIDTRTTLLYGAADRTVPPRISRGCAAALAAGEAVSLGPLGHLAHEEAPEAVAATILDRLGVSTPA